MYVQVLCVRDYSHSFSSHACTLSLPHCKLQFDTLFRPYLLKLYPLLSFNIFIFNDLSMFLFYLLCLRVSTIYVRIGFTRVLYILTLLFHIKNKYMYIIYLFFLKISLKYPKLSAALLSCVRRLLTRLVYLDLRQGIYTAWFAQWVCSLFKVYSLPTLWYLRWRLSCCNAWLFDWSNIAVSADRFLLKQLILHRRYSTQCWCIGL